MEDWNVVVTIQGKHFRSARQALQKLGSVARTDYYNVLVMRVDDVMDFLHRITVAVEDQSDLSVGLARVLPVTERFIFQSPNEFESRVRQAVEPWLPQLAGHSFHVRMHRRGFKGKLSSQMEEQFLDYHIIEQTAANGNPARVDFNDPDDILAVETIGQQAGLSLWSREARERFTLLHLD